MLKLQDTVFAKSPDGKQIVSKTYDKVYFTHTQGDETETVNKQFDGKADAGKAVVPKGNSKASIDRLYNEMLDFIKSTFPGSEKNPTNPQMVIMEMTEKGYDLSRRATEGALLREPFKEVNVDKVLERTAKGLVSVGIYDSYDAAIAALKKDRDAKIAASA